MSGITMLLMRLTDWMAGRKHDERLRCRTCDQKFDTYSDLERHKRESHGAAQA